MPLHPLTFVDMLIEFEVAGHQFDINVDCYFSEYSHSTAVQMKNLLEYLCSKRIITTSQMETTNAWIKYDNTTILYN
jgi:hypothetical protein